MKKVTLILSIFSCLACAEPKYLKPPDQGPSSSVSQKVGESCMVQFKKSGLCLSMQWDVKPTETTMGSFSFRVYKLDPKDQFPVLVNLPQLPLVVLWMSSMGHGSSPVTVTEVDIGTYKASNVFFIMGGQWEIIFKIKIENLGDDEAVLLYNF